MESNTPISEDELQAYCGKVIRVRRFLGRRKVEIPDKRKPLVIQVDDVTYSEGLLTSVGNGLICFDHLRKPGETYAGFNVLTREITGITVLGA